MVSNEFVCGPQVIRAVAFAIRRVLGHVIHYDAPIPDRDAGILRPAVLEPRHEAVQLPLVVCAPFLQHKAGAESDGCAGFKFVIVCGSLGLRERDAGMRLISMQDGLAGFLHVEAIRSMI